VRRFSGTDVPDAVSGFRAFSREAAMQINILSRFSYTIEMLIQSGKKQLTVASVPIRTNPKTRESRLFRSVPRFIERSLTTMVRVYAMYQPLRVFFWIGTALFAGGLLPILRFLYFYFAGYGEGKIQSLVLGGVLVTSGVVSFLIGLVADLISHNRRLIEMILERVKRLELGSTESPADELATTNQSREETASSISRF